MSAIQELLEQELARCMLEILGEQFKAESLVSAAEQRALRVVQEIQSVLDDQNRSDFDCVEEIVCILHRAGVSTFRHDYG